MGNSEAGTPPKSEKASSSVQEQTGVHPYPDWAAMQAYYGPGVGMPPPYFSTAVTTGHAPHPYMWGPQPLMPPFGTPYPAIYPHGGVYSHPSIPLVQAIAASSTASEAVTVTQETPAKSSSNKDRGLMKKLKGFDGLAVSIGNGNGSGSAENEAGGAARSVSQSEGGTEGSSDGSDGSNSQGGKQIQRKRRSEDTPAAGKPVGPASGTSPSTVSAAGKVKTVASPVPLSNGAVVPNRNGVPPELWIQDERELKRERRKQSNRESARRSRLRKQAESEELATKVDSLNAENLALKAEISRLAESSAKLRLENTALMDKLKNVQSGQAGESSSDKAEPPGAPSVGIENFLSKIDNASSFSRSGEQANETQDNSGGKLHQLLESNPRTDAVAAG